MSSFLPTYVNAETKVALLYDSLKNELQSDTHGEAFTFFTYAISVAGWEELQGSIRKWVGKHSNRSVAAYVGLDHGLTDPEAIQMMKTDGVTVRLVQSNEGCLPPESFLVVRFIQKLILGRKQ